MTVRLSSFSSSSRSTAHTNAPHAATNANANASASASVVRSSTQPTGLLVYSSPPPSSSSSNTTSMDGTRQSRMTASTSVTWREEAHWSSFRDAVGRVQLQFKPRIGRDGSRVGVGPVVVGQARQVGPKVVGGGGGGVGGCGDRGGCDYGRGDDRHRGSHFGRGSVPIARQAVMATTRPPVHPATVGPSADEEAGPIITAESTLPAPYGRAAAGWETLDDGNDHDHDHDGGSGGRHDGYGPASGTGTGGVFRPPAARRQDGVTSRNHESWRRDVGDDDEMDELVDELVGTVTMVGSEREPRPSRSPGAAEAVEAAPAIMASDAAGSDIVTEAAAASAPREGRRRPPPPPRSSTSSSKSATSPNSSVQHSVQHSSAQHHSTTQPQSVQQQSIVSSTPSSFDPSHLTDETEKRALESDLAETKMRLALVQAERDELEFELLQGARRRA